GAEPGTALLLGLLGSGHCLGMCGGLAGAFGLGGQGRVGLKLIGYNLGRISTYTLLGAVLGLLGAGAVHLAPELARVLRGAAGLLLIALGLFISGWWMGLTRLEKVGLIVWRRLQPLRQRLPAPSGMGSAYLLGTVWGLLPCGLVYSTLALALSSGRPGPAALTMFCFGLGTLPSMLASGAASQQLRQLVQRRGLRNLAGLVMIGFGLWTLLFPWLMGGHHH
ncbi:MAG TPA: sulfite exporter TauE/SafE family protein, partial [Spongiibacteraceae bacterium]|nr:sulfite exporter TauE/SafE family protein [Spongiibacteraceae bacterium]